MGNTSSRHGNNIITPSPTRGLPPTSRSDTQLMNKLANAKPSKRSIGGGTMGGLGGYHAGLHQMAGVKAPNAACACKAVYK